MSNGYDCSIREWDMLGAYGHGICWTGMHIAYAGRVCMADMLRAWTVCNQHGRMDGGAGTVIATRVRARAFILGDERSIRADERYCIQGNGRL